jgi:putative transposase
MIEPTHHILSITKQCKFISLPRSSYYRVNATSETAENLALMRLIDEEYMRHPF